MEEKSLIKKQNNMFEKIKNFFRKIFGESRQQNMDVVENNHKENIVYELKKENRILQLQRNYENGTIKKEDLSNGEKEELLSLYKKQIINLEDNIENYKKLLQNYKVKIIEKRNKMHS